MVMTWALRGQDRRPRPGAHKGASRGRAAGKEAESKKERIGTLEIGEAQFFKAAKLNVRILEMLKEDRQLRVRAPEVAEHGMHDSNIELRSTETLII